MFNGDQAVIEVGQLSNAPVNTLWLYLLLGIVFGVAFNQLIFRIQDLFQRLHGGRMSKALLMGDVAACWGW
ncbi:hypothetical protein BBW68_04710 [Candidatus Erwinia dacicola]|uniref:Uncharacterized protein n=1 Tax=Candidatus Erwinia dacicola TaxID=252393 RepID=A0A1E7Z4P5_9GAMM|nr:hypothetical protein BBW68_04710 [Candidatus Erwinia dacicola]